MAGEPSTRTRKVANSGIHRGKLAPGTTFLDGFSPKELLTKTIHMSNKSTVNNRYT